MRAISEPVRAPVAAFVAAGALVLAIAAFVAISGPAKVQLLGTHNTGIDTTERVVTWGNSVVCPAGFDCDAEYPAVTVAPSTP